MIFNIIWGILTGGIDKLLTSIGMNREQRLERALAKETTKRLQSESYSRSVELTNKIFGEDETNNSKGGSLADRRDRLLKRLGR